MKLIGPSSNIVFYFCTNRYICLLSTTSLKIALFMDNKLRLNIAGPRQEINVPKGFAQWIDNKKDKLNNETLIINDEESYCCIEAERALLEALGGDCNTAVGGLAKLLNEQIVLKSELFSNDGNKKFVVENSGSFIKAREIGYRVGEELLKKAGPDFKVQGN